ncbi:MAG: hypothetical protein JO076_10725 [Verrucomicrobia bacterium]|nr:hypothetical protein [Verrucomicrobiota bacterium]
MGQSLVGETLLDTFTCCGEARSPDPRRTVQSDRDVDIPCCNRSHIPCFQIHLVAHRLEHQYHVLKEQEQDTSDNEELFRMWDRLQFRAQLFHFLGEVEAVFGIWLIPLGIAILVMKGWSTLTSYAAAIDSAEPIFVVVVMSMASSRPVLAFAEACLAKVATWGDQQERLGAWRFSRWGPAGIFYHGTRGHDDLCAPASTEVL